MKKAIIILLTIIIVSNVSYALCENEISFLDLPWLSDEETVLIKLKEKGFIAKKVESLDLNGLEGFILAIDENGNVIPSIEKSNCLSVTVEEDARGKIAGYPVKKIILTFAYNGSLSLVFSKVELYGAKSKELFEKLQKVYGECKETETIEGYSYLWVGEDNSCVVLFNYGDEDNYELCYGRLDAADILSNCIVPTDPDDISGL